MDLGPNQIGTRGAISLIAPVDTNQRFSAIYTLDGGTETIDENVGGLWLGGRVDFDFGASFARIEYRYPSYGTFSKAELETHRHQILLTAGLRFSYALTHRTPAEAGSPGPVPGELFCCRDAGLSGA